MGDPSPEEGCGTFPAMILCTSLDQEEEEKPRLVLSSPDLTLCVKRQAVVNHHAGLHVGCCR